jgi:hypothetical protein
MTELFDRFEINRVPRWPLMSRLVALSVVLHGVFLVAVIYVPTLRGMLNAAGSLAGIEFVSEDFDRSLIGQRATIIKLEPHQKLYYPADYFGAPAVAEISPYDPTFVPQVTPPAPPPVIYRPQRVRAPRMRPTPQPSPSPAVAQAQTTPTPAAQPSPDDAAQKKADEELDKIAAANGVERPPRVNTLPFEEIASKGKTLVDQGKVNLNSAIDVSATAERLDDGTLDPKTVKIDWHSANDETMAALAQEFITALSQSKVLGILKGAKDVRMSLKLDEQNVSVEIRSEVASEEDAAQKATGYGVLLFAARKAKEGTDEGELYNRLKVSSDGKQFIMTFEMPRDAAGKMIAAMLAKKAAAAAQNKS